MEWWDHACNLEWQTFRQTKAASFEMSPKLPWHTPEPRNKTQCLSLLAALRLKWKNKTRLSTATVCGYFVQSHWLIVVCRANNNYEVLLCLLTLWISRTLQVTRFIVKAQQIRSIVYCSDTALVIPVHTQTHTHTHTHTHTKGVLESVNLVNYSELKYTFSLTYFLNMAEDFRRV